MNLSKGDLVLIKSVSELSPAKGFKLLNPEVAIGKIGKVKLPGWGKPDYIMVDIGEAIFKVKDRINNFEDEDSRWFFTPDQVELVFTT